MDPVKTNPPATGDNNTPTDGPAPSTDLNNSSLPPVEDTTPHPFGSETPSPVEAPVTPLETDSTPTAAESPDLSVPTVEPAPVSEPAGDTSSIVPPENNGSKPKMKVIGAIVGILLLVGSVVAGVTLVGQNQETREKASSPEVTSANVEYLGNGRVRVTATGNSETTGITAYLVNNGELIPVSGLTKEKTSDEGPVGNLPPNNYRIRFVPNTDNQVTGTPVDKEFIVPSAGGGGAGGSGGSGAAPTMGAYDFSPRSIPANTPTRISYTAVGTDGATEVVLELQKDGQVVKKLDSTFANDGNNPAWQNSTEVSLSAVGMYKLVFTPMNAGTKGAARDVDFVVTGNDTSSTAPQIVDAPSATPGVFTANQASRITICASGNGSNTDYIIAKLYKIGVEAPLATIGSTWDEGNNKCDEEPWPANIAEGNYAIKFTPMKGSTAGQERTFEPIKVNPAGVADAGDVRCTQIEPNRGTTTISPSDIKVGETINFVVFCYTTDTSDDFDRIRITMASPTGSQTKDGTPVRVQSKDVGTRRYFQASIPLAISAAGNYSLKAWGHTPKKDWKGRE